MSLKIKLTSVLVDDQDKALKFYTEVLGFVKSKEIPLGTAKWLTPTASCGTRGSSGCGTISGRKRSCGRAENG